MAVLIPSYSNCAGRMQSGERRFAQRLEDKLDDGYLCWYDVPIGPKYLHPDFVILHPNRGILTLEVKDWKLESIAEMDRASAVLHTERGRTVKRNPLFQAKEYARQISTVLQRDPALVHPPGHRREGQPVMPWGFGVVLTNITRQQFETAELGAFINPGSVLCRDEMTESTSPEVFQKYLWDMFFMPFPCNLTLPQIDRVRWHMFPQLRIQPQQGDMFSPQKIEEAPVEIPDLIRVMDLQQEQLARSLGEGHRVIHGVAGSGKTMILGYRCIELAKRHAKPTLVLCYNKTLAARLEQLVVAHGVSDKVCVFHFHGWCTEQLSAYSLAKPRYSNDWNTYNTALVEAVMVGVESGTIPRAQYSAVLIDEGQDFAPEWLRLVVQMVDPETNSLLLLYDDAQSVYANGGKRKFTFKSIGIEAQGRTTILRLNYRNTLEVLAVAKTFAEELLASSDDEDHPIITPESIGRRGPMPELAEYRNVWDEAENVANRIADALDEGTDANDIGILCYSNATIALMTKQLEKSDLPYKLVDDKNKRNMFEGTPAIKLMTMKSSKGLEFDTVFIPHLNEVAAWCKSEPEKLENEARLLYVAMTRSLRRLHLSHHGQGPFTAKISQSLSQVQSKLAA